jgi:muramoyltetrapeptide carboxypeptidase
MKNRTIPPPLKKGDTIRIIAPGGRLKSLEPFRNGIAVLEQLGFTVRYPDQLWPGKDLFADSDSERAEELNRACADDTCAGIMTLRGGYGCLRMLQSIDLDLVRSRPKMLIGFSDITVLQNHLLAQTGLLSLHGPVLTTLPESTHQAIDRLYHCLTGSWRNTVSFPGIEILRGGATVSGLLTGGNLTSLVTMLGTPYDFSWQGRVVFLEDTGEPLYRLDRMLTQLALAGKFHEAAAILLGDFFSSSDRKERHDTTSLEWLWQRVLDLTDASRAPVWGNLPVGHVADNMTLPLGAEAAVNSSRGCIAFS